MKRVLSIVLSLLMVISAFSVMPMGAFADLPDFSGIGGSELGASGSCGDNVSYTFDSATGTLEISGSGKMTDYNALSLNVSPFNARNEIKTVTIKKGVTGIGTNTFAGCTGITTVNFATSITSIGERAFTGCTNLYNVTIPSGMTKIEKYVFLYCSGMRTLTIPNSVKTISDYAFYECDSLREVTYTGTKAEWNSITISAHNESLTNATVTCTDGNPADDEAQLTKGSCGEKVMYSFAKGTGTLTISGTGDMADTDLPFASNKRIKYVVIESGVTSIGAGAFSGCNAIKSVTIPKSVKTIKAQAFKGCTSLYDVNYYGTEAEWKAITIGDENDALTNATKHYNYSSSTAVTIPCLVHNWQDVKILLEPTCEKEGLKTVKCKNCDATETQSIPPTGHTLDSGVVKKAPTTKETGLKVYTCIVCKSVMKKEVIPKLLVNKLNIRGKAAVIKYSKLKAKDQSVAQRHIIVVRDGQGVVSYKKLGGNKKIKINKTTGKVTVKKGLKKGTYTVKVKVRAAGNSEYAAKSKTTKFKIVIK